jgi:membrane protease YdiL (CAAX protease family)
MHEEVVSDGRGGRGVRTALRRHPLAGFFVLAFLLSWSWWVPLAVSGARVRAGSASPSHFPGLVGPALAALIVTAAGKGAAGVRDLFRRMVRWPAEPATLAATTSPLLMLAVTLAGSALAGRAPRLADLGTMSGLPAMSPIALWLVLTLWNGLGEEAGWRGFALPLLQERFGPLRGTLLLTAAWAAWHVPVFFALESYGSIGLAIVPGFVLGLAAGAVVLTWLYNRTGGSVLAVAVWHGSFNLATGTRAAQGVLAAAVSTVVMIWGVELVVREVRAQRRREPSVLAAARTG